MILNWIESTWHRFKTRSTSKTQRESKEYPNSSAVNVVILSMVKNEQDVIEPFLRHNARLADLVILLDNGSTDRTREIAFNTAREFGNIIVTDWPDRTYNQSETMTNALRFVQAAVFSDFVFFLDVDEFLSVASKQALLSAIDDIPVGGVGLIPWKTLVPDPKCNSDFRIDPLESLRLARQFETPQYFKAILRMGGELAPGFVVSQGNHHVTDQNGKLLPQRILNRLFLWHAPVRSADQILAKGAIGWRANRTRKDATAGQAWHWKRLHDLAEMGISMSPKELALEALNYASEAPRETIEGAVEDVAPSIIHKRRYSDAGFKPWAQLLEDFDAKRTLLPPPLSVFEPTADLSQDNGSTSDTTFSPEWHWDNFFLDEPPIRFLVEYFRPKSVLDIGCGIGVYPSLCQHLGVEHVLGVDGVPLESTVLSNQHYLKHDLHEPLDLGRKFDLVLCLEVAEHLEPNFSHILFETLAKNARDTIIFSMAEEDQPGNGHINCMNIDESLSQWASLGWCPDIPLSLGVRAVSNLQWFRRNLIVLRKGAVPAYDANRALEIIGHKTYRWHAQPTGQRHVAFTDPFPSEDEGYGTTLSAS